MSQQAHDVIVIGSGIGGTLTAHALVRGGARVLMLERGGWPDVSARSADEVWGFFQLGAAHDTTSAYQVESGGRRGEEGMVACVGGAAAYYGGVSLRLREQDFAASPEVAGRSGARWPIDYAGLEPFYTEAERLLDVAGETGADPTEPPHSAPYPRPPSALAPISRRVAAAARALGLHPFHLPLALDARTEAAAACDGYALAGGGRADLGGRLVRDTLQRADGFQLRTGVVVTRLREAGGRIVAVEGVERATGEPLSFPAERVVLAAGSLASPHLLLASGLERLNPGGATVGRYLMRHCNAFVYGFFSRFPEPGRHHKQVGIHDFYSVAGRGGEPRKLGGLQQVMHPQLGGVLREVARRVERGGAAGRGVVSVLAAGVRPFARRMSGLQVIAEDEPRAENRVELLPGEADRWGLPRLRIRHEYTARDLAARAELVAHARRILRAAGALPAVYVYPVTTFSHAVGTVRMGDDPAASALDAACRFRGIENLRVVDGSFMPTSGGVNPSLTIAANALRVGHDMARH